jgi:hypothetical protein
MDLVLRVMVKKGVEIDRGMSSNHCIRRGLRANF